MKPTSYNYPGKPRMISLIIGPMFSGKTTELIRQTKRYHYAGHSITVVKYAKDTRYSTTQVQSHNGVVLDFPTICVSSLEGHIINTDIIAIDEGQFIDHIQEFAEKATSRGQIVLIAGLDADFNVNPFPRITSLVHKAEKVKKLRAVCACGAKASFSKLISTPPTNGVELIGGSESYKPVCRVCFNV